MAVLKSQLVLTMHDGVSAKMRHITGAIQGFQNRTRTTMAPMLGTMSRIAAFGGAYIGVTKGISGTVGASIRFEEAFADVRKVIDGTPEQMENIRRQILGMSRVLPNSASDIAAIYAAAGQSNIPINELGKFSEMVAKVAVAWEVSEGETSDALAKIKNQLGLNVQEIGLYADAINHLGNNTAAKAPDLVDFSKRVAAQGDMFGYSKEQSLAFGGAMVAMGAQTEVAATSFRNMGNALTVGMNAKARHKAAFALLGFDAKTVAKDMQKNAIGTTLKVIEKIQKLPEWQRISVARQLFGDEARALMPIINDSREFRRQLDLIGDSANYAGSSFQEYMVRADTASNALKILSNKFADTFRGIGDKWLPSIKEMSLGIGDVLDSLGERATPLQQLSVAFQGFMKGMGFKGGAREMMNDLGDLLLGTADGSANADKIGAIFVRFEKFGKQFDSFKKSIADNPIAEFVGGLSGYGFKLMLASAGFGLAAMAIMKLGRALYFLSGASAAVAIIKQIGRMGKWFWDKGAPKPPAGTPKPNVPGGSQPKPSGRPSSTPYSKGPWGETPRTPISPTGPRVPGPAAPTTSFMTRAGEFLKGGASKGLFLWAAEYMGKLAVDAGLEATGMNVKGNRAKVEERFAKEGGQTAYLFKAWSELFSSMRNSPFWVGKAADPDFNADEHFRIPNALNRNGNGQAVTMPDPISMLRDMVLTTKPTGTQDVKVTNPVRPNVSVNVTVNATTNASPESIGSSVGERVKAAVEGSFSDGGY